MLVLNVILCQCSRTVTAARQRMTQSVLRLAALGLTKASIAKKLSLGEATVSRILAKESAQKPSKSQN